MRYPATIENVDTDQIIPARFLKATERKGFGDNLLETGDTFRWYAKSRFCLEWHHLLW
jgi:3-isopropylmalate dehydratase small subunit